MAELVKYHNQVTAASSGSNLQPVASRTVLVTKRGATVNGTQTVAGGGNLTLFSGGLRFAANDIIQVAGDITLIDKVSSVTSDTVIVLTNGMTVSDNARVLNLGNDSSGGTGTPQYDGADSKVSVYSSPLLAGAKHTDNKVTTDADGEYSFWIQAGVYDIHIMDASTQLGANSQTLPDVQAGFGGHPFSILTETGTNYLFNNTIRHSNQAVPSGYNNGFVGMYLRYDVLGADMEALSTRAGAGLFCLLNVNGNHTSDDIQSVHSVMQAVPNSGQAEQTPRTFWGELMHLGTGTITNGRNVETRASINSSGNYTGIVGFLNGPVQRSIGVTGTVTGSFIGFKASKSFIRGLDAVNALPQNTLPSAGSLGIVSNSRVYIQEDFGDATWTGSRLGIEETIPTNDNTIFRLGALYVDTFIHGGNTERPTVATFKMNYPDETTTTTGSSSSVVSVQSLPDFQPATGVVVPGVTGLEVIMQLQGSNANATVTDLSAVNIAWSDGVADAATYTNARSIDCNMPNHISTSTATMTNRTGLYIDEDTQPAGATWTTSRGIDIEAPLGTNTFHMRMQPISTATPKTTLEAMTAAEGDMVFVTDTNNADNTGLHIYMNSAWYSWTPGGVAAISDT